MAKEKINKIDFKALLANKKLLIIIGVALVVLIVAIIIIVSASQKSRIKSQIKTMFNDIQSARFNTIANYIDHKAINDKTTEEETENQKFKILLSGLSYKIESINVSGNKATVKLEVKNRDIQMTLEKCDFQAFSELVNSIGSTTSKEEMEQSSLDFLQQKYNESDELITKLEVVLDKENGKWEIKKENQDSRSMVNAILPRYLKYLNQ